MEKTIEKNEEMFCYQCQETAKNIACTKKGVEDSYQTMSKK